jgi:hypothetical protein
MKEWAEIVVGAVGVLLLTAVFMLVTVGIPILITVWAVVWAVKQFLP